MYDGDNHFPHDGKAVVRDIAGMIMITVGSVAVLLEAVVMVRPSF